MTVLNIGKGALASEVASIKWVGLDTVIKNLNKEIEEIKGRTVKGLLQAGLRVKADAQRITPVDTGNLKSSAYVLWGGGGRSVQQIGEAVLKDQEQHDQILSERTNKLSSFNDPFAEVGYTANYALKVHEGIRSKKGKLVSHVKIDKEKGAVQIGQAKFLEQSFNQNKDYILNVIKRNAFK